MPLKLSAPASDPPSNVGHHRFKRPPGLRRSFDHLEHSTTPSSERKSLSVAPDLALRVLRRSEERPQGPPSTVVDPSASCSVFAVVAGRYVVRLPAAQIVSSVKLAPCLRPDRVARRTGFVVTSCVRALLPVSPPGLAYISDSRQSSVSSCRALYSNKSHSGHQAATKKSALMSSFLRSSGGLGLNLGKRDRPRSLVTVPYSSLPPSNASAASTRLGYLSDPTPSSSTPPTTPQEHLDEFYRREEIERRQGKALPVPDRGEDIVSEGFSTSSSPALRPRKRPRLALGAPSRRLTGTALHTPSASEPSPNDDNMSIPLPSFSGAVGEPWEPFERRLLAWLRSHSFPDDDHLSRLDCLLLSLPPSSPASTWYLSLPSSLQSTSFPEALATLKGRFGTELRKKMCVAAAVNRLDMRSFRDPEHPREMCCDLVSDLEALMAQAGIENEASKREYRRSPPAWVVLWTLTVAAVLRCFRGFSAALQMMARSPSYDGAHLVPQTPRMELILCEGAVWAALQWESSVISKLVT